MSLVFLWGYSTLFFHLPPNHLLKPAFTDIKEFADGHDVERTTSILQKFRSDIGGVPYRHLVSNPKELKIPEGAKEFSFEDENLRIKGYMDNPPEGYILFSGGFNFTTNKNLTLVLFSTSGEYIRHWHDVSTSAWTIDSERGKFVSTGPLHSKNWCDEADAEISTISNTSTHHSVEVAPDGTYWSCSGGKEAQDHGIIQFDPDKQNKKGNLRVLRKYTLQEVSAANPDFSPLNILARMKWDKENDPERMFPKIAYIGDSFHLNDIQPFVDERFPTELGYALLASVRNLNLVLVLDPSTMKILWHSQGYAERQHDVDYVDGNIYIFDNGPFRGYSRIAYSDLEKPNFETIIDGRDYNWYDPAGGRQDTFTYKEKLYHLFANIMQGELYLFNEDTKPLFVIQNLIKDYEGYGGRIFAARFIPKEEYEMLQSRCEPAVAN